MTSIVVSNQIDPMKYLLILQALLCFAVISEAQTVIIDFTEKTLDKEYSMHILSTDQEVKSSTFESVTEAKAALLQTLESYQKDGFGMLQT